MDQPTVNIVERKELFSFKFFRWETVQYRTKRLRDGMDLEGSSLVFERGSSVAILLHDGATNEIILVEQLRVATVGSGTGWLLELPAGKVDEGEDPRGTAIREIEEETGAKIDDVEQIYSFYPSPGACSEEMFLFYAKIDAGITTGKYGGLESENEDIKVHRLTPSEAMAKVESGEIRDAKTIIALQWLAMRA